MDGFIRTLMNRDSKSWMNTKGSTQQHMNGREHLGDPPRFSFYDWASLRWLQTNISLYFFKISRWPSKGRCQWHMLSIVQWYTTIDSFWISLLIFIIYSPLHSYSPPTLTPAGFEHRQAGRLTIFPRDHAVGKEQGTPHIRIFSRYPSHRIGERQHTIWIAIKEHTSTWMRLIWCPFILAHVYSEVISSPRNLCVKQKSWSFHVDIRLNNNRLVQKIYLGPIFQSVKFSIIHCYIYFDERLIA